MNILKNNYFLTLRLTWYRQEFFIYIKRYRIALTFMALWILPIIASDYNVMISFFKVVALPFIEVSNSNGVSIASIVYLALLQIFFVAWIANQKNAVIGNPLTTLSASFPISSLDIWKTNVLVVTYAGNLMWLIFLAPIIYFFNALDDGFLLLSRLFELVIIALLIIVAQTAWIYRQLRLFFGICILDGFYLLLPRLDGEALGLCLLLLYIVFFGMILVYFPKMFTGELRIFSIEKSAKKNCQARSIVLVPPSCFIIVSIYLKMLFGGSSVSTVVKIAAGGLVALFIVHILQVSRLESNVSYIYICFYFFAFYASSIFPDLSLGRESMKPIFMALPIPRGYWFVCDCLAALCCFFIMSSPLLVYSIAKNIFSILNMLFMLASCALLLILLYPLRNGFKEHGGVAAFSMFTLWSGLLIFLS